MSSYGFNREEQQGYDIEQLQGDVSLLQDKVSSLEEDSLRHENGFATVIELFEKMQLPDDAIEVLKDLREQFYGKPKTEEK